MTHTEAIKASKFNFATRTNMLYGEGEQFICSSRYYRLIVQNAECFQDWSPLETREPLEALRRNYPYIKIIEPVAAPTPVQGQKTHGRKQKKA